MIVYVKLLRPFADIIGKSDLRIDFNGTTLTELLNILVNKYPELKYELFTKTDELTDYICIFINDKPASALDGLQTELKENDEILFFVPVSGG
jgi:MoaD family protein